MKLNKKNLIYHDFENFIITQLINLVKDFMIIKNFMIIKCFMIIKYFFAYSYIFHFFVKTLKFIIMIYSRVISFKYNFA